MIFLKKFKKREHHFLLWTIFFRCISLEKYNFYLSVKNILFNKLV
jgi:hypothetical protein